jgi:Fe-S-cluster-containing dehydrogenase component
VKVFVVDIGKCSGCYNCQVACKDEHCENDWMPYAKPQPHSGQFWMRVKQKDHGQVPKVWVEYTPWPCMHCDAPKCAEVCPESVYKREDGLVIIDPQKATGHSELVDACPYGAIFYNEKLDVAQKCTGCAHLVDEGRLPHCVDLCATGGLRFGEEEEFTEEIAHAETMLAELGTKPRVYYLNRPHLFVGGEVWNPAADEIIEGAKVALTMPDGTVLETATDDFGDFYFRRLDTGTYRLRIEAEGFAPASLDDIRLEESLNLGDFPLKERVEGAQSC